MKIKLKLLLLLFRTREHQLACRIASADKQDAQMPILLAIRVASA